MSEMRGVLLVLCGLGALGFYYSWWFEQGRWTSPILLACFIIALAYSNFQLVGNWILYLATHYRRVEMPMLVEPLTIDILITACGEPVPLVRRALTAACAMRGNYRVYLLDDGGDPALAQLAEQLGVGYLTRSGDQDAKAGNLNAALARTHGDVVAIFDIDHAPCPDFVERTLPHFADPAVGFVQVMLTFENQQVGWVAQAAADSSLDFYNPTAIGTDGIGGATLMGSNALIRRRALESISGYQPGLAEDLATSVALHTAGWRSVYVAEPLAPGFAPPDLTAWFTQQLKWARGVFELLLTAFPRSFTRLGWGQRVSYGVRMTYYWIGPVVFLHLLATVITLWRGSEGAIVSFNQYLLHAAPLGIITLLIRQLALRRWRHRSLKHSYQVTPLALVYATWPAYTAAWLMALLRVPLGFRATPKSSGRGLSPVWILPQLLVLVLLLLGAVKAWPLLVGTSSFLFVSFVAFQAGAYLLLLTQWLHVTVLKLLASRGEVLSPAKSLDQDVTQLFTLSSSQSRISGLGYHSRQGHTQDSLP